MAGLYIVLVLSCLLLGSNAGDWNYNDISAWDARCDASHMKQSPINIVTSKLQFEDSLVGISLLVPSADAEEPAAAAQQLASENGLDGREDVQALDGGDQASLGSRSFAAAITAGPPMNLANNGHAAVLTLNRDLHMVGSDLGDTYKAHQLHFHWGSVNGQGSEHTVDGQAFPIEMHIVTYDSGRFSQIEDALDGMNSLAVLGVLFEISDDDNALLAPIISKLGEITQADTSVDLSDVVQVNSLLPENRNEYYRYYGGLTTPPCFESVVWTVFAQTQSISQAQLDAFRALHLAAHDDHEAEPMVDNFRPIQKLHDRTIHSSFIPEDENNDPNSTGVSSASVFFTILLLVFAHIAQKMC